MAKGIIMESLKSIGQFYGWLGVFLYLFLATVAAADGVAAAAFGRSTAETLQV